jgi:hypothetical protein
MTKDRNNGEIQNQLSLIEELFPGELSPNSKYPQLFANAGIFVPTSERKSHAAEFDSGIEYWYDLDDILLRRFGPGLDIYDEDTVIAVWQLVMQKKLIGTKEQLSKKLGSDINVRKEDDADNAIHEAFVGVVTPYQVNKYLGKDTGGKTLKDRRESIIRLGRTSFEMTYKMEKKTTSPELKFFKFILDDKDEENGSFRVFLDPLMVSLMQKYFIINIDIRRELTNLGKSVHRYLTTAPCKLDILIETMKGDVRHTGSMGDFVRDLRKGRALRGKEPIPPIIDQLKELGFLSENTEIQGTGRAKPFRLVGERISQ